MEDQATPALLALAELGLTFAELDEAKENDEGQSQEFGSSEGILYTGGRLHTVAVHSCEQY